MNYGKISSFSSLIACVIVIFSSIVNISVFDKQGVELISGILFGISSILAFINGTRMYNSVCFNFLGIIFLIGFYFLISPYADMLKLYGTDFIFILLLDAIAIIFAVIGMIAYVFFYLNEAPL
ncbi:MAG: hypothetical protein EU529_16510 [Promethearchaeota archaeon]|nr:MAG: hypothetical protein EU529_16510 [Candidatus Lokiarchaeota archaeon]